MREVSWSRIGLVCLMALLFAVSLTACGGGDSSSSSSAEGGGQTQPEGEEGSSEDVSAESGQAAAKAAIKPYVGHPSPFPVSEKLTKLPAPGSTFAFMSPGVPYSELIGELTKQGVEKLGAKFELIKAGLAANTVSSAFDTVVAKKPAAVIISALEPALYTKQLKELQAAGIPVVGSGMAGEKYGIDVLFGNKGNELYGKLEADYVAADWGPEANVVFYEIPEYSFTEANNAGFKNELEKTCPDCTVRFTPVPASSIGNTAPSTIVSDLQANPETEIAVFAAGELEAGLPTALNSAGIKVKTLAGAPGPSNLQAVKEGKETAVLATDTPVVAWTLADMAARKLAGQELSGIEAEGLGDIQFLTKEDITFDPEEGWTGYPNYAEMFENLWGVGG
jgi:ribose transport system substrate-binding protein